MLDKAENNAKNQMVKWVLQMIKEWKFIDDPQQVISFKAKCSSRITDSEKLGELFASIIISSLSPFTADPLQTLRTVSDEGIAILTFILFCSCHYFEEWLSLSCNNQCHTIKEEIKANGLWSEYEEKAMTKYVACKRER